MQRTPKILSKVAFLLGSTLVGAFAAAAQSPTPVPKLNLNQFTSAWYEQARLPDKREKPCVSDNAVLYSLGDKKNTFQIVISCLVKNANWQSWNSNGKLDPSGSGRLKLKWIWPFTKPYWVIATAPDMQWIAVGTPNRKSLWLLSRTQTASPEVISEMRSRASAEGYDLAKLITVVQHSDVLTSTEGPSGEQDAGPKAAPRPANAAP